MTESERSGLESGLVIASRYRVDDRLGDDVAPVAYAGLDTERQRPVLVLELDAASAKLVAKAKDLGHRHLANVLEVSEVADKHVLVCEHVAGETLADYLPKIGHKEQVDAVRSALRVVDALASLHEAGGAHGSVHPKNVVLVPEDRDLTSEAPVLAFGPVPTSDRAFRQPEWEVGDGPSEPDDSWAVAALLHSMLTGQAPPRAGYESASGLEEVGVVDEALKAALYHALARDIGARSHDLHPLKRELARWFVMHAGDEPLGPGPHSTQPPPLPPSLRPSQLPRASQAPRPSAPPPKKKPSKLLMLASFGVAVGLIGGWVSSKMRGRDVHVVEVAKPTPRPPPKKAFDLTEVPVNGRSETESVDKVGSCVAGYLPKGSFDVPPSMSWVCDESDPRVGAERLRVSVINGGKGGVTDAMKIFSRIGWYDMAAFSVVRGGCCENAKPLSLPASSAGCPPMTDALRDIASAVVAARSYEEPLKAYGAAVECESNAGQGAALHHPARPASYEASAFGELVHAVQP